MTTGMIFYSVLGSDVCHFHFWVIVLAGGGVGGEIKSQLGGRSRLYIMLCYHYRNDFSFSVGQWCMSFSLLGDCWGGGGVSK